MNNTGIILVLAYPDTIVSHADEWYSKLLRFIGIGSKKHVRAGHAALVLIEKKTGLLEYHDFGRYITPEPYGRVRGQFTDAELAFSLKAEIKDNEITNLSNILEFLATHPKLTHGDGRLIASVCDEVNYNKARAHISNMQQKAFIRYAAFIKDACNCARFVTDSIIASVTNKAIKNALQKSKWFTPSTVGNVLLADTKNYIYEVSDQGAILKFEGSQRSENITAFLDRIKGYNPSLIGTIKPKQVEGLHKKAQWLSGIAAGAWFELHDIGSSTEYRFRRLSPYGHVDVDATYQIDESSFNYESDYKFIQYSNCAFFKIKQGDNIYNFKKKV